MSQKSKIEITTATDFQEKVGFTEAGSLDWKEGQVIETTQDALSALKESMKGQEAQKKRALAEAFIRENEKKDATISLEDKLTNGLGKSILKNPAVIGAAGVAAAGVGAVAHGLDKEIKKVTGEHIGIMDSIRDWLKDAVKESDGFMKMVWGFLYKIFGGHEEGSSEEPKPETQQRLSEQEKASGRHAASKAFEKLYGDKKIADNSLQAYFVSPELLSKTPKELEGLKGKGKTQPEELAKELGFKEGEGSKVLQAIELLLSSDTSNLMKNFQVNDRENTPIGKLFSSMARYMEFLDNIRKKGTNVDIKDMGFMDGFDAKNLTDFVGEKREMLSSLKGRFEGFSPKILSILHTEYTRKKIGETVDYSAVEKRLNPLELKFLKDTLPEYAKSLPALIRSFSFGSKGAGEAVEEFLKKNPIYYNELIDIFVLSGGNTDINKMNAFEKSQVLTRLFLMIRNANGGEAYKYVYSITSGLLSSSSDITIPPEVKMILKDVGGIFKDATLAAAKEMLNAAIGFFKLSPAYASGSMGIFIGLMYLAWRMNPVGRAISAFMWLATALGLTGVVIAGYKLSDDGKKVVDVSSGKTALDVDSTFNKLGGQKSGT